MPEDRNSDFAAAVRRAGVSIPDERWEAMRDAFEKMRALLKVLNDPLAYQDEPASLPRYDAGAKR